MVNQWDKLVQFSTKGRAYRCTCTGDQELAAKRSRRLLSLRLLGQDFSLQSPPLLLKL
jgi:hypothetical protein